MQLILPIRLFFTNHIRLLLYVWSALLVSAWTLLRFFNHQTIFDLIGQQVLAGQWLDGHSEGANIGVTNYILKIFLFYMPLDMTPGSPRLSLIVLTIIINVTTIVLIGLLLERILREFKIKPGILFYGAFLWLAAIAGSVFWVQFTNSRNLEVVGGLFLLYVGLRYIHTPSTRQLVGITALGTILFFSDTLQFYMTAIPLIAYALLDAGRNRQKIYKAIWLTVATCIALVGSKLLFTLASQAFSLTFLTASTTSAAFSLGYITQGITGAIRAAIELFSGGVDAGKIRQVVNLLFLLLAGATFAYAALRRFIPKKLTLFIGIILITNLAIYIVSGQAHQADTSRYLIMTAPVLVLVFGSLEKWLGKKSQLRQLAVCGVVLLAVFNTVTLGIALYKNWDTTFPKDAHLRSVEQYLSNKPNTVTYASMDTALPLTYLTKNQKNHDPLPLSCTDSLLAKNYTFYDRAAFDTGEARQAANSAIIFDGNTITNTPHICTIESVTRQFGRPKTIEYTNDGSTVLLYDNASLERVLQ